MASGIAVVLELVWLVFGIEPPDSADYLSLGFGFASLVVVCAFVVRMELPPRVTPYRWSILTLVLLGTISNVTFLTWLSSGLETALFNFLVIWWLYEACSRPSERGRFWALRIAASGALVALTRPDGYLMVAGTVVILIHDRYLAARRSESSPRTWTSLIGYAPSLLVPLHVVWRRLSKLYGPRWRAAATRCSSIRLPPPTRRPDDSRRRGPRAAAPSS
jgi:arabinofuranosyltransferase